MIVISEQARAYHPEEFSLPHTYAWCCWYLQNTHVPTSLQTRVNIAIYQIGQHCRWTDAEVGESLYRDYQSLMSCLLHLIMASHMLDKSIAYMTWIGGDDFLVNKDKPLRSIDYKQLFMRVANTLQHVIDLERPLTHTRRARSTPQVAINNIYHTCEHISAYVPYHHRWECIKGECVVMAGKL